MPKWRWVQNGTLHNSMLEQHFPQLQSVAKQCTNSTGDFYKTSRANHQIIMDFPPKSIKSGAKPEKCGAKPVDFSLFPSLRFERLGSFAEASKSLEPTPKLWARCRIFSFHLSEVCQKRTQLKKTKKMNRSIFWV